MKTINVIIILSIVCLLQATAVVLGAENGKSTSDEQFQKETDAKMQRAREREHREQQEVLQTVLGPSGMQESVEAELLAAGVPLSEIGGQNMFDQSMKSLSLSADTSAEQSDLLKNKLKEIEREIEKNLKFDVRQYDLDRLQYYTIQNGVDYTIKNGLVYRKFRTHDEQKRDEIIWKFRKNLEKQLVAAGIPFSEQVVRAPARRSQLSSGETIIYPEIIENVECARIIAQGLADYYIYPDTSEEQLQEGLLKAGINVREALYAMSNFFEGYLTPQKLEKKWKKLVDSIVFPLALKELRKLEMPNSTDIPQQNWHSLLPSMDETYGNEVLLDHPEMIVERLFEFASAGHDRLLERTIKIAKHKGISVNVCIRKHPGWLFHGEFHPGDTALIIAARNGHLNNVKKLIAAGADISIKNEGHDALSVARERGHIFVVDFLETQNK